MKRLLVGAVVTALLSGCAVGPDFHEPAAPSVTTYLPGETAAPTATTAASLSAEWWTALGSKDLNDAVERALAHNADLAAARATLRVAQEQARAQRASLWPTATVDLNVDRQHTADALSPNLNSAQNPYTLRTGQVAVAYAPDLFGGARRAIESADAQTAYQASEVAAARTTLAANVVLAAVQDAALSAEVVTAEQAIAVQTDLLALTRRQRDAGAVSTAVVIQQESALAQQQAALPALRKQREQNRDAWATLMGGVPASTVLPTITLAALTVPVVPVLVPSQLVAARPDIRAASALLHAASANVGVALAAQLPQLSLTATLGRTTDATSALLGSAGRFWDLTGDLAQPIFQGGALRHRRRAAEAALDAAKAQYRSTVLGAFQNVADVLWALDEDTGALDAAVTIETTAQQTWDLVKRQVAAGDSARSAALQAQSAWLSAHINRLSAEATRLSDTVALYQALGGGWASTP